MGATGVGMAATSAGLSPRHLVTLTPSTIPGTSSFTASVLAARQHRRGPICECGIFFVCVLQWAILGNLLGTLISSAGPAFYPGAVSEGSVILTRPPHAVFHSALILSGRCGPEDSGFSCSATPSVEFAGVWASRRCPRCMSQRRFQLRAACLRHEPIARRRHERLLRPSHP